LKSAGFGVKGNRSRKRRLLYAMISIIIVSLLVFETSYTVVESPYYLALNKSASSIPDYLVRLNGSKVYYTSSGNVSLISPGAKQTLRYLLIGGAFGSDIFDNKSIALLVSTGPFVLFLTKSEQSVSVPFTGTSVALRDLSLSSPQKGPQLPQLVVQLFSNSTWLRISSANDLPWVNGWLLSNYPGIHTYYLNFTLIPYSDIDPLVFPGTPIHESLRWNITMTN
jgi:hypothetical protein